jgi:polyhydroxyalkanoate synthesis regulator phasin
MTENGEAVANEETEPGETHDTRPGPSAFKKLYLASLGGGVVIQEESGKLFEYLVERGTPLEEPVRQRVANARDQIARDVKRAGKAVNRAVGRVVSRHSSPKDEEIAELSAAVDRLQDRMGRL